MLKLIASDSFLTVNKYIMTILGLDAAVLLAELASKQVFYEEKNALDESGMFYQTVEQIQKNTTLSQFKQGNACAVLEKAGVLKTKKKGIPPMKYYHVDGEKLWGLLNQHSSKNLTNDDEISLPTLTEKFDTSNKRKNKNLKERTEINNTITKSSLSEPVKDKVLDFLAYREEIKKPYKSERSIKSLVSQIEKQEQAIGSIAVIHVIDTSMQNGWQGLFWDKVPKPKNTAADMAEIARMMDEGVL